MLVYRVLYRFLVPGGSAKPLVSAHDRIMGTHRPAVGAGSIRCGVSALSRDPGSEPLASSLVRPRCLSMAMEMRLARGELSTRLGGHTGTAKAEAVMVNGSVPPSGGVTKMAVRWPTTGRAGL